MCKLLSFENSGNSHMLMPWQPGKQCILIRAHHLVAEPHSSIWRPTEAGKQWLLGDDSDQSWPASSVANKR